jgi:hypothetical protein
VTTPAQSIAGLCALAVAGAIAIGLPANGAPIAYVAFVNQVFPSNARFHVERDGHALPVTEHNANLAAGDRLYVDSPDALITVRYIANNSLVTVRRSARRGSAEEADLTVGAPALQGLTGVVLAWFEGELSGADQGGHGLTSTLTRGGGSTGSCYNESGRTDDPTPFSIPILGAERSEIAAGDRSIFISWRGGAAPYTVTLSDAQTGTAVARSDNIRDGCWVRLPARRLAEGRYALAVVDGNGSKEEETGLFVVDVAPSMPQTLRDAQIDDNVRNLYYATWLSAIDKGEWAFEAQQFVAGMDCRSSAVQDWLRRWGDAPTCK